MLRVLYAEVMPGRIRAGRLLSAEEALLADAKQSETRNCHHRVAERMSTKTHRSAGATDEEVLPHDGTSCLDHR